MFSFKRGTEETGEHIRHLFGSPDLSHPQNFWLYIESRSWSHGWDEESVTKKNEYKYTELCRVFNVVSLDVLSLWQKIIHELYLPDMSRLVHILFRSGQSSAERLKHI